MTDLQEVGRNVMKKMEQDSKRSMKGMFWIVLILMIATSGFLGGYFAALARFEDELKEELKKEWNRSVVKCSEICVGVKDGEPFFFKKEE